MRNFEPNKYILKKDYCLIELKTYKDIKYAKISLEDIEYCKKYKWRFYKDKSKYYVRSQYTDKQDKKRKIISLHRYLMNPNRNLLVDHINGDGLDNRRSNLRIVNSQLNSLNRKNSGRTSSTGIKHVYKVNDGHKDYYAVIIKRFGQTVFCKYLSISSENLKIAKEIAEQAVNYINKDILKEGLNMIIPLDIIQIVKYYKQKNEGKKKLRVGYAAFCNKIKDLDNYTCCGCSKNFKDNPEQLEVHHIITRRENPNLIKDINNCISLCKDCHYLIRNKETKIRTLLQKIVKYRNN